MKNTKSIILFLSVFTANSSINASDKFDQKKSFRAEDQTAADDNHKFRAVRYYCSDITLPQIKKCFKNFTVEEVERMHPTAMFCAVHNIFSTASTNMKFQQK